MFALNSDMMRGSTAFGLQKIVSFLTANRINATKRSKKVSSLLASHRPTKRTAYLPRLAYILLLCLLANYSMFAPTNLPIRRTNP